MARASDQQPVPPYCMRGTTSAILVEWVGPYAVLMFAKQSRILVDFWSFLEPHPGLECWLVVRTFFFTNLCSGVVAEAIECRPYAQFCKLPGHSTTWEGLFSHIETMHLLVVRSPRVDFEPSLAPNMVSKPSPAPSMISGCSVVVIFGYISTIHDYPSNRLGEIDPSVSQLPPIFPL